MFFSLAIFSSDMVVSGFKSNLLTHSMPGTLKCSASSKSRCMSCTPETVGSVTTMSVEATPTDAMTGQPTTGGPSVIISSHLCASANVLASCRTSVTSLPEFYSAMLSLACTMAAPYRVSAINHSPQFFVGKSMACSGHKSTHTPQPSQSISLTLNCWSMVSKRHRSIHCPH